MIEILEQRIAPATLIDAHTFQFTDFDGDAVTIVFSKDIFNQVTPALQLAKANEVFKFSTGNVVGTAPAEAVLQQLQFIDFTKFTFGTATGIGMTITATQQGEGNGLVDVGAIKATGVSLGTITIDGDLGQIDAGGALYKVAIAGLNVNSIGKRGVDTQILVASPTTDNPASDLVSTITGELTSLKVTEDFKDARFNIVSSTSSSSPALGNVGSITIGGSLLGRVTPDVLNDEATNDNTGLIEVDRQIGKIIIGTDSTDGIVGGEGKNSGRISAKGEIGSVIIKGSISGGSGADSGSIFSKSSIGTILIEGSLAGGIGLSSGKISTQGNLNLLTINGDILAGTGTQSGTVYLQGSAKNIVILGDIDGTANGTLTGLTPQLTAGTHSGGIIADGLISLTSLPKIGLPKVTVNGSIIGGAGSQSGYLESEGGLGTITILHDITGGAGTGSGAVIAGGDITKLIIKGNIAGGSGVQSGVVFSGVNPELSGNMNSVAVSGFIQGGAGAHSGSIIAGGDIKTITAGAALLPGLDALIGGNGNYSGEISATGKITTAKILGNLKGGAGSFSGGIFATDRINDDGEFAGDLSSITISGQVVGGAGISSGIIQADGNISKITAKGIIGGTGSKSASIVAGTGFVNDGNLTSLKITGDIKQADVTPGAGSANIGVAGKLQSLSVTGSIAGATVTAGDLLKTISVAGSVSNSNFLAGYSVNGTAYNADAQISSVTVKGNWTASNMVAGAAEGADDGFGNPLDIKASGVDDEDIVSKIANVVIGGSVTGNAEDSFGFVAQVVAKMKVGSQKFVLNKFADSQTFEVGGAGSGVAIREIGLV